MTAYLNLEKLDLEIRRIDSLSERLILLNSGELSDSLYWYNEGSPALYHRKKK